MKNTFLNIFIILSIGCFNKTISQDFWEQLYFPDTTHIRCISVDENDQIFIGAGGNGMYGGVFRSFDMGNSWEVVLSTGDFTVQEIAINEIGDIYIGKTGFDIFMVSEDKGESWDAISLPAYGNIVKILPYKTDTLYVSTWEDNGALLLRSTDRGESWDSIFTSNKASEYVSDVLISNSGDIYISLTAFQENMGGVFKSADNGINWEFIGLFNHQITSLAFNGFSDLFAGSWGGLTDTTSAGLFVLRYGEEKWEDLTADSPVSDIVINSENHIYFSGTWPNGVVRSLNDGDSFELIIDGLPEGEMRSLFEDHDTYLYVINFTTLAKSINPTVSISEEYLMSPMKIWTIYPNPANDILNIKSNHNIHDYEINKVVVYNAFGSIVKTLNTFHDSNYAIDVSDLCRGTHFIEICSSEFRTITKIIIN